MNDPPDQTAEFRARELVVGRRNDLAEVFADQVGVFTDRRIRVGEDHALLGKIFLQRAVDDFAFELGFDAGQELLLRLGNAELVEGLLDLIRNVVPGLALMIGWLEIVEDVLEVDVDVAAPLGHRLGIRKSRATQAEFPHPAGLVLHLRNLSHDLRC